MSDTRLPAANGIAGRILVVDADRRLASSLAEWLCENGYHASAVGSAAEALRAIDRGPFAACVLDAILPADGTRQVAQAMRAASPAGALVLCLPEPDRVPEQLPAAEGTLVKPPRDADLLAVLLSATRLVRHRSTRHFDAPGAALPPAPPVRPRGTETGSDPNLRPPHLLGSHPTMRRVMEVAARVASTSATILITGESGTGKSLLARQIHAASGRGGRFVELACGGVAESLLDSELFGHVPGAFTGATARRDGRFLLADGGTIFLDEIATASPGMQVKLLRVLQERQFEPLGARDTLTVDARAILATNENLADLVAAGRFRADLFWRISVVVLEMPALRERAADIPCLAGHFLAAAAARAGRAVHGFAPAALDALLAYRWPGNVRELEHAIERAVLLGEGPLVELSDLPTTVPRPAAAEPKRPSLGTLREGLATPERRLILDALDRSGGRRDAAAQILGINRTTLYKKLKRLGMDLAALAPSR